MDAWAVTDIFNRYGTRYARLSLLSPLRERRGTRLWLSAPRRAMAETSLLLQGVNPRVYIQPATVHGPYKVVWHQGIALAVVQYDVPLGVRGVTRPRDPEVLEALVGEALIAAGILKPRARAAAGV